MNIQAELIQIERGFKLRREREDKKERQIATLKNRIKRVIKIYREKMHWIENSWTLAIATSVDEVEGRHEARIEEFLSVFRQQEERINTLQAFIDNEPERFETQLEGFKTGAYNAINKLTEDLETARKLNDTLQGVMITPVRFAGVSEAERIGNAIIDALVQIAKPQILVDRHEARPTEAGYEIKLKPRHAIDPDDIDKYEGLLINATAVEVGTKLKVSSDRGLLVLDFKCREVVSSEVQEDGLPGDWYRKAVLYGEVDPYPGKKAKPYHLKFVGESESGKSSAVKNAINIMKDFLPGVKVRLADPLAEVGESSWDIPAEWQNDEEAIQAIRIAAQMTRERKANPNDPQEPNIFIIDEIDTLLQQDKSLAEDIRFVWKQGRHLKVWLWGIGQSPNVKDYPGMTLADFNNCVCCYMNQSIPYAAKQYGGLGGVDKVYDKLLKTHKYLMMVKPKLGAPFVTASPKPDSYQPQNPELTSAESFGGSSPENMLLYLALTKVRAEDVLKAYDEGLTTVSGLVEKFYDLKPSRSKAYLEAKAAIESVLKTQDG